MKITVEITDEGVEYEVHEPFPSTGRGKWYERNDRKVTGIVFGNAPSLIDVTEYTTIGLVMTHEHNE